MLGVNSRNAAAELILDHQSGLGSRGSHQGE
jgi:hypothetical protein